MEIPYLLNNSPDLHGKSGPGEHWAGYELNGEEVDHEAGPLGKIRVHDDYWNLDDDDKKWYNYDIRNEMKISEEQLNGLLNISNRYSIALLLHAQNFEEVWKWSRTQNVIIVNPIISQWSEAVQTWAAREYNYLMEDEKNANFSGYDHVWPGTQEVAKMFVERMKYDNVISGRDTDRLITQPQWMTTPEIYTLWESVGIESPSREWIDAYIKDYNEHQEYDINKVNQLKDAYDTIR
jgi:hypothetical protein